VTAWATDRDFSLGQSVRLADLDRAVVRGAPAEWLTQGLEVAMRRVASLRQAKMSGGESTR
jgi:hypothetical protein